MIVPDANILVHLYLEGEDTSLARAVAEADPDWAVPPLWRDEFGNVLVKHHRAGKLTAEQCGEALRVALAQLEPLEVTPHPDRVLDGALRLRLSYYDANYVVLAERLHVWCITEDQQVLRAAPATALSMRQFLEHPERRRR